MEKSAFEIIWFLPSSSRHGGQVACRFHGRLLLLFYRRSMIHRREENEEAVAECLDHYFARYSPDDFRPLSFLYTIFKQKLAKRFTPKALEKRFPKELREMIETEIVLQSL